MSPRRRRIKKNRLSWKRAAAFQSAQSVFVKRVITPILNQMAEDIDRYIVYGTPLPWAKGRA